MTTNRNSSKYYLDPGVVLDINNGTTGVLVLWGTGNPEGITTAPPGSKFYSTNGAEYRKTGGTYAAQTNTGWQVVAVGSGTTNLGYSASSTTGTVTSSTGSSAIIPAANGTDSGLLVPTDFLKLSNITVSSAVNLNTLATNSHAAATAGNAGIAIAGQSIALQLSSTSGNQLALDGTGLYFQQTVSAMNTVMGNYSGSAPAAGIGNNGDYAIDITTGNVYGPKAAGVWPPTPIGDFIVSSNLTGTPGASNYVVTNSNGSGFTLSAATQSLAGMLSAADKTKQDQTNSFTAMVGNGVSKSITVTHNLGTKKLQISLRETATDELVLATIKTPTTNTAVFEFSIAPASNELTVEIAKINAA